MPFGIIGRTGPGIRQVVGFGDRSTGRGTFELHLERAIVTNGNFTAYLSDCAATRPSSQITLGKLVSLLMLTSLVYSSRQFLARDAFVRTNRRIIAMMFVRLSVSLSGTGVL